MKGTLKITQILLLGIILALVSCEQNPINSAESDPAANIGIPADEITWVSWKPEFLAEIRGMDPASGMPSMKRAGSTFELITAEAGGVVGGDPTWNNRCAVPPNAIQEDGWFAVQVTNNIIEGFYDENHQQGLIGMIDESTAILTGLMANPGVMDDSQLMNDLQTVIENIVGVRIYYVVYSVMVEPLVFSDSRNEVVGIIYDIAMYLLASGENADILPQLQEVCGLITEASRQLAATTVEYADSRPVSNQRLVNRAYTKLAAGDELFGSLDADFLNYGIEWFQYKEAIRRYRIAWELAKDAMPEFVNPTAEVDFLPDTQFECNVSVTLPYESLDLDDDDDVSVITFYSMDEGETWIPIENFYINTTDREITFDIDHFTRFAWGLLGNEQGD